MHLISIILFLTRVFRPPHQLRTRPSRPIPTLFRNPSHLYPALNLPQQVLRVQQQAHSVQYKKEPRQKMQFLKAPLLLLLGPLLLSLNLLNRRLTLPLAAKTRVS